MPTSRSHRVLRILITMTIALAVSTIATFLGMWQYGRHVERADAQASYERADQLAAVPVSDVVEPGVADLPAGVEWRTVTATGTFDPDSLRILRTRPVAGVGAWQYLAWLEMDTGQSMLVGLGWIPQPGPNADPAVPDLDPSQSVTVTGVMRTWEPDDGKESGETVSRIAPEQLPTPATEPVPGYMMLREWCDADVCVETPVGQPVPLPALTLGPHLAYAWQWWLFAAMAPIGGIVLLRRDARIAASTHPDPEPTTESPAPGAPSPAQAAQAKPARTSAARRRRLLELSDEEIEDAL